MVGKIRGFVKDSYNELLHKVTWPTWSELQNSAIVVMVASLIIALLVYLMDLVISFLTTNFYETFA